MRSERDTPTGDVSKLKPEESAAYYPPQRKPDTPLYKSRIWRCRPTSQLCWRLATSLVRGANRGAESFMFQLRPPRFCLRFPFAFPFAFLGWQCSQILVNSQ
jgi:hypothetical protein